MQANARVFFALVPPPSLSRALAEIACESARHARGRPVPAENMHVTLAFIGAWPSAQLPVLLDAAAGVHGEPIPLSLDRFGAFRRAGIAWIGSFVPPDALMQLAASLSQRMVAAGVALDAQPFRPHMTLARHCRGPYPQGTAGPFSFVADRFSLMQSETRAEGARYRPLATWALRSG